MSDSRSDSGGYHEPMDAGELRELAWFTPSRRFMFLDTDTGQVEYFGCEYDGEVAISRVDGSLVGSFSSTQSAFTLVTMGHDLRWIWLDPEPN